MELPWEYLLHHPLPDPPPDGLFIDAFVDGFGSAATTATMGRMLGKVGESLVRGGSLVADDLTQKCGNVPPRPHLPTQWAGVSLGVAARLAVSATAVGGVFGEVLLGYTRMVLEANAPAEPGRAARQLLDVLKSDPMPARELHVALRNAQLEQLGIHVDREALVH